MQSLPASSAPPVRGRPPKRREGEGDACSLLVRAGVAAMTEYGFTASGLDRLLKTAGIPKGSFYYYFDGKDAFALAVVEAYAAYFAKKLDRILGESALPVPVPRRLRAFCADAARGLVKYDFRRGCLVGNLGQEITSLGPPLREALARTLADWETRLAACLREGKARGEIAPHIDPRAHAAYFWTGWEGAILRARLERDLKPLKLFERLFLAGCAPRRPLERMHAWPNSRRS